MTTPRFFIALGRSGHPLLNSLLTEADLVANAEALDGCTVVPVEVPWASAVWSQQGGRGHRAYPKGMGITSMRIPDDPDIVLEVKRYAVWLAATKSPQP